jgi:hypothetical protein
VYRLEFRFLGYADRTDSVRLNLNGSVDVEARLAVSPLSLPPLAVTVDSRTIASWLAAKGFAQRGFDGGAMVHTTYQQLTLEHYRNLDELLRNVPGVRIRRLADGGSELILQPDPRTGDRRCRVGVYLNGANVEFGRFNWSGARWSDRASRPMRFDDLVRMSEIDGLELYGPHNNPVAPDSTCGTLMIWSSKLRSGVDEDLTGEIRGTAVDAATGQVLSGVRVVIDGTGLSAVTDASGTFHVSSVLPGRYGISAHYPSAEPWQTRVDVLAYGIVELALRLERRGPAAWFDHELTRRGNQQIQRPANTSCHAARADALLATQSVKDEDREGHGHACAVLRPAPARREQPRR